MQKHTPTQQEIRDLIDEGKATRARFAIERYEAAMSAATGSPHQYLSYHAPYVAFQWALEEAIIDQDQYERARVAHGNLWNYVGD